MNMNDLLAWWAVGCFLFSLLTVRWWLPVLCWRDSRIEPFYQGAVGCLLSPLVIAWLLLVLSVIVGCLYSRKIVVLVVDYEARRDEKHRLSEMRPPSPADADSKS